MNADQINEMANQIRYQTDPEIFYMIADKYADSLKDLLLATIREQAKLNKLTPLAKLPNPSPNSIVSWLKKLTTGLITPQLKAQVKYVKKVIEYAQAVENLISAVQYAANNLKNFDPSIILDRLESSAKDLAGETIRSFVDIDAAQRAINSITNASISFDVSSPKAFLDSFESNYRTIDEVTERVMNEVDDIF